ncbi:MAG: M14 family zinc carboxypeptidase, partial [Wenzhouxiangellaceae bacterium]
MPCLTRLALTLALPLVLLALLTPAMASLPGLDADSVEAPAMEELLGFAPGDRHPHHHELVSFYRELARRSDRVEIETIGRSTGGREQVLLYFGREINREKVERLRADRVRASRDGDGPPVIWLGYSVHGNEASGASAAAVTAWYLATSDDERVQRWLDELIIVMEPMVNPDGIDRFAHWVNMHRGRNPSADPNDREHNEVWPNGRTSYYWFDLNRDWMPLTHPVSRNRIAHYQQWRPHVLTDKHEMGGQSSYFFQPGIPERNNPATPERVFELTARIAEFHADILDQAGEPYYNKESFDDYYLGKGSTYPDLTGGIGILFEQGSARGHRMDTPWGERSFADAIANQVRTSISTLEAGLALGDELIEHQRQFFAEARRMAGNGGWIIGDDDDPVRARGLLELLLGHGIEVRPVDEEVTIGERRFGPGQAWAIPDDQDQLRFIRAIFDTPTDLPMETFYDVSAWPLQHAFDLPLSRAARLPRTGQALAVDALQPTAADVASDALAWGIPWHQHRAPAVLAALLAEGYRVQALEKPAELNGARGPVELERGSVLVHSGIQPDHLPPVGNRLAELAGQFDVEVHVISGGLARDGIDLGSPNAPILEAPKALLLTGSGVTSYSAGFVWRYFDLLLDQPVTRVDTDSLPSDLADYTHIIAPSGRYSRAPDELKSRLQDFVRGGGQLIALGNAAGWVESLDLGWSFADDDGNDDNGDSEPYARYADHELDFARTLIGGSALQVQLDTTHPLGYGYRRDSVTTFRQGAHILKRSTNRYATPGHYADNPLVAGYLHEDTAARLAATPAIAADRLGAGLVVRIADEPLFRGYWVGTERLVANALFFGQLIG